MQKFLIGMPRFENRDSVTVRRNSRLKRMEEELPRYSVPESSKSDLDGVLSEDDFVCSCCYEILINPTTLTCGHSFCRFCLAQWWHSSRNTVCPECRQQWHGFPKVNFTLRNTIERLFPSQVKARMTSQSATHNYSSIIKAFDDFGNSRKDRRGSINLNRDFNCGLVCMLVSIGIALIVLMWVGFKAAFGGSRYTLSTKPVTEWTPHEVAVWIRERGSWANGVYDERFVEAGIDGTLLLRMTEQDLISSPISMTVGVQRRVLMKELDHLRERKLKVPSDFWEYKAAHNSMSMFLLFGLKEFPRATLAYLYLFNYHDVYLPFVHRTCSDRDDVEDIIHLGKRPTWNQWLKFSLQYFIAPYYLLGLFAYDYLSVNWWTSRIVILQTILLTACELSYLKWFLSSGYRRLPRAAFKYFLFTIANSLFHKLIWPFIPSFICDCVFYWMLYVSPFDALYRFWKRITTLQGHPVEHEEDDGGGGVAGARWNFNIQWNA